MPTYRDIQQVLEAVGEVIVQHIYFVLESGRYPLDRRTSPLLKSLQARAVQARSAGGQFTASASLELYALDYLEYLDRGRPKFTKKVPLDALLKWMRKRKIFNRRKGGQFKSANQLAFLIQNAIYRNGIRGRHFLTPAFSEGQQLLDIYLNEDLLNSITLELDQVFKKRAA
ncbi:hypothetical protein [Hymenobacter metallilatus]|uniref:Uncharacterized protein n=1 Tax=Hymenobacter metallilatus TaxID=2493666 RepID=A0A428JLW9_9BACT|nr:hypothetical protein [Hymenobacter metallilatus]RSK33952.1 hypothetical protein EI290_09610 [Hymenobacter metallilatus]